MEDFDAKISQLSEAAHLQITPLVIRGKFPPHTLLFMIFGYSTPVQPPLSADWSKPRSQ